MKKCKLITISILMLAMIQIISAGDTNETCETVVIPNRECRLLTPSLTCYTNYTITSQDGTLVEENNMSLLRGTLYYINFTQDVGDYIVTLCDNSTRELYVRGDESKMLIAISGLIIGMIILFGYLGYIFYKEESFVFYLSYLFWLIALLFPLYGMRAIADSDGVSTTIATLMNTMYQVYLWVYYVVILMFVVYILALVISWLWWWHKTPAWKRKKLQY